MTCLLPLAPSRKASREEDSERAKVAREFLPVWIPASHTRTMNHLNGGHHECEQAEIRRVAGEAELEARGRGTSRETRGVGQVKMTLEQYRTQQTVRAARETERAAYWAARTLVESLLAARLAAGARRINPIN